MIVGNGLIAKAFYENYVNNDNVLIFASGVSNSSNTDPKEFLREKTLLESHLSEQKKIVYFSTCSIEDPSLENSPYILHKLEMEQLVKESKNYLILRLPQLAGRTDNPNTLLNFLYNKIKNEEKFFAQWHNPPHDFSLDLYAYYQAKILNMKVFRFPVLFRQRAFGSSHWNINWQAKIKFIKRTIDYSSHLKKMIKK